MLFNRQGLQQKNWRMVKKGKYILFGCSLFFVVGGVSACVPQVTYAGEINDLGAVTKQEKNSNIGEENSTIVTPTLEKEKETQSSNDELLENTTKNKIGDDKAIDKKEINAKELKNLVDKIKNTDTSKKTEKSVKELNLVLLRAEKALDNKEVTQEEIDKEVKTLKEVFDKLEDKPREDNKSEVKEKVEFKKDEKVNSEKDIKEKQQDNNTKDVARRYNEKITKATNIVKEINSLASEINYEFSDTEKELVSNIGKLPPTDNNSEESIQKLLNEAIYLRNKVANRVTRAHSGKRDPRNGKVIENSGESTFRGIVYKHKENRRDGNLIENGNTAVYYNSDEIWSLIEIKGERVGNERKFTTYARGKVVEDVTPYYIVTVGFTENSPIKGLKMQVAFWDKKAGVQRSREIEYGKTEINNPITNAAIRGVVGQGGIVQPGRYEVHIASNTRVAPNQLKPYTFTFIIKPQSERNTLKDLSQTYVDDVRHLTETEKTALIEKFKTEHPDVMTPSGHKSDFERAEISADGTSMTIYFKDGFNPKTIQTNAINDVEAKHTSLTAYFGDSKELYTNPRQLVRSKTGHEVPTTAQVTYKTPFNLQQAGTRNVVVTTTYQNGVNKDVTTPYTVLDFIGKQDKKINQNQSGQLGDARNYITVSDNSAIPSELTVRWKDGLSNIDTSAAGVQHKEIEILRGSHLMKTVNISVEIVDNINPTITAPDTVILTRAEGLSNNISVDAQDNARGVGLKDTNPIVVENLANPLRYNPSTKRIELSGVIPNQLQSFQATVKAVDKKGNTATKAIRFNVQAQTDKYTAVANQQKQTVSYLATPSAEASVSTTGLPTGTRYTWKTTPNTSSPGDKTGVVEVTYPDTSKDTVNVTVSVRKLSDEYAPTGTKIVRNQNVPVTNNDLKAAVTISNNGNSKVKSVTPVSSISTANAGTSTIKATVTYLDNTTDPVDIPLEVKDVTAPTIQTPSDRQNWDLIALDRTLPSITVTSVDNNGGTGIKSTTVTGLPDFLVYDNATKTIKFKNGVQEVTKLPVGQNSKTYTATIQVTDNANNPSQRQVTITVKSMTTKYEATPNPDKQTVSYGVTPDAGTSINKNGLPAGTRYTWATMPSTTSGPGDKAGVVEVTYPDDSIDTVNVTVNVRRLADEYTPTGTKITREQNTAVTNDDLKAAVTISNNGNNKVKSVIPVGTISTAEFGNKTINATVTYLDDTTDSVTIPLEVRDVTKPTIQTPIENQLWEVTSLDKTFPPIKIKTVDNVGGSGVKNIEAKNLPSFLKYDKATSSIVFQDGVYEVPKLSGISRTTRNVTFIVEDNAGNRSERNIQIRQISMAEKYNPQANTIVQKVNHGESPNPKTSVNTVDLPGDTRYAWNTTPDTSKPGDKTSMVTVTYPDDSVDEVTAIVKVRKLSDEYNVSGAQIEVDQNTPVTNDDLKAKVTATSKVGNVSGTDKIAKVEPKVQVSTAAYGETNIEATVTFKDGTTKDVTIPLKVKDATNPTIQSPTNGQNWDLIAVEGQDPNIAVTSEDNTGGSGVKSTTVAGLPNFLEYNESTKKIQFKEGVTQVPSLPLGTDVQPHNVTIEVEDNAGNKTSAQVTITVKSMTTKYEAIPNSDKQTVSYGATPDAGISVNTSGLPEGTNYAWTTTPDTNTPGEKDGVVEVTYKDGSKDTVNVKVTVKELSSEYGVTGVPIEVNQNTPVTNDDLKAKVTATSTVGNVDGTDKIAKVEPKARVSTAAYGETNIEATVTFKDGTTKEVTIPLKVKDVTPPTITAPEENKNWEMTALNKTLPNMEVRAEDNANGSGIKTVSVEGLPDYLEYDSTTNSIKFKSGKQEVEKLPDNTPSKEFNLNIRVEDNAGNVNTRTAKITVSSISAKTNPQPKDQMVNYGQVPNPEDSVNKQGLPDGTTVTWKTPPVVNTPGSTTGEVEITYPDGSKDVVTVNVTVRKVSEEYTATGTQIEVNQNEEVTSDMLKGAVNATNAQGENGNAKIAKVESTTPINTTIYGDQTIQAKVTYIDGSEQDVTIPLKVKDVTDPTILTPEENKIWEMTALDKTLPVMKIKAEDNANGSGIATIEVRNMPSFLTFDESTGTITFKEGVREVPEIKSDNTMHGVTIIARDKAGNSTSTLVNITVWSMRGKYDPQPKPQTVDNGTVPNAEDSVDKTGLPEGTTVTWKTNPDVSTPGSHATVALVTYPDGTVDEITVPITVKEQKDTFNPTAKQPGQTAKHGSDPSAEGSINTDGLPKGTTYTWVEKPDTNTTPGSKPGKVLITYPDNSTEEVTVTVEVTPQKDDYDPQTKPQTVDNGTVPNAEDSVDKTGLPSGTTIAWKETPVVNTPGSHPTVALVTYPDGTVDEVTVPITVKEQKDTFNPTAKQPGQTAKHGSEPSAEGSINTEGLPSGTTYTWVEKPDTNTTPGSKPGKVLITYPDNSTEEVTVTVEVTPQKDDYDPQPKPQTVDNGTVPNAEDSVDKTGLPSGTTIAWKETPVVNTPGSHPTVALVTYPDGTVDEVTVPITVKEQKDTFNPTAKQPGQTAKHGSEPSAEGSINTEGLPKGTTYTWVEKPDTNTTPGSKPGKVLITYPDNSTEEVTVTVEVTPQKDDYNPQPKPQTITNGDIPNAKDSIGNVKELPDGTKIEWEDGVVPSTNVPGKVTAKITITYPDGTQDEVEVTIIVNKQTEKGEPEEQPTLPEFNGGVNGEPEEQPTLPEFNGGVNGEPEEQPALPEFAGGVNGEPEVQPTLPEFSGGVKGEPEVQPTLLEFVGGVNGIPEEQPILPEFAGGVKGEPEVQPALPEFVGGVKGEPEVQPTLPEFSGGVNGAPETLLELPEYVERINDESKIQPVIPNKSSKITKRLANTGETTNNSELSGLGLAIVGLFAAIKRRKKNEE